MPRILLSTAFVCGTSFAALADTIEVEMLNKNEAGDRMVFSQELIRAEVGDVIRFLPTDKSHNAQSVKGAVPEGQEAFRGKMNKAVEYKVTETGMSAIICLPHQALGMVALVVVGDDLSNADQILEARIPGKGGDKIEALVEQAAATQPGNEETAEQGS